MNLKTVLRTYALLRQLTDDETALLNTLRQMNESERELLVESLAPAKVVSKKKATKKAASTSGNNRRGLPATTTIPPTGAIVGKYPMCTTCGHDEDYEDHAQPSPHFHPFSLAGSTTAPPATRRSSRNGQEQEQAQSSGTATAGAGDVQAASAGGE